MHIAQDPLPWHTLQFESLHWTQVPDVDRLKAELQAKQKTSVMQFWQFRIEHPEQSPLVVRLNPGAH